MSNQMRKAVFAGFILSSFSLVFSLVVLLISGQFLNILSWLTIGLSLVLSVILLSLYIDAKKDEKKLRKQVAYYKLVHTLREKALLDFYSRFGLTPQYDKDGRLLTPDEVLGILTKLNSKGKLDESVYEMLGILPQFDSKGREIPRIIVLKHLIRAIKKDNLKEVAKLKGLHKESPTKLVEDKKEKQKAPAKKNEEEKSSGGKKKGGQEKISMYGGKLLEEKFKGGSSGEKSSSVAKPAEIRQIAEKVSAQELASVQPVSSVTPVQPAEPPKARNINRQSYVNRMWQSQNNRPQSAPKPNEAVGGEVEEYGEGTFE